MGLLCCLFFTQRIESGFSYNYIHTCQICTFCRIRSSIRTKKIIDTRLDSVARKSVNFKDSQESLGSIIKTVHTISEFQCPQEPSEW